MEKDKHKQTAQLAPPPATARPAQTKQPGHAEQLAKAAKEAEAALAAQVTQIAHVTPPQAGPPAQAAHSGQAAPAKNGNSASRPISSLVISEPDSKRIGEQLDRLLREAGATTAMLLDRAGEVIAMRGEQPSEDVTNLGALLAGTFATSREIARQLNETQFRSLSQQGMKHNTLTELVGEVWLVVIMFDKSTHVGLVKDVCRQVTPQLEAVLLQVQRQSRIVSGLNPAFRTSVEDTIDLLFKD